jgi:hypothetical protein
MEEIVKVKFGLRVKGEISHGLLTRKVIMNFSLDRTYIQVEAGKETYP